MSFSSFFSDVIATVVGGIVLTLLFFLVKEKLFPLPKLTGQWYLEQLTQHTAYIPYKGMILRYVVMLWCDGDKVKGTAEKIYEKSANGERSYEGTHRTRATIDGYVERRYTGKDRVYLHVVEAGKKRESSHYYELSITDDRAMNGKYASMVADQDGLATFRREPFK